MSLYVGYDIGSVSVNRAIIDKSGIKDVLPYTRHFGNPIKIIIEDFGLLKDKFESEKNKKGKISAIGFTGSGGKNISGLLGVNFINEIEAIISSIKYLHKDANTVIEIGGQDSKFIDLAIGDYAMNELCAAGTGSFLDQQATRFGLSIEEFSNLALKSEAPATIAGRCSVFAKTDMIHLQQEAARDEDIAFGLCYAMARNFKSGIVKGKKFTPPIVFCGGVSFNKAMIKAFENILGEKLIIPKYRASAGAIGTAIGLESKNLRDDINIDKFINVLEDYRKNYTYKKETFKSLTLAKSKTSPKDEDKRYIFKDKNKKIDAYLGIDVGSISTNVVAIDENKNLIAKCYLRTAGRPIEAVRKGVEIIGKEVGSRINVRAAGTTGSGRYLIGDFVGADIVINEITAQATAAVEIDSSVDTIFEIGGQDSKYISLEDGVIVDFEMNKVCAAGTGSFLEEQAERFDVKIQDFGDIALRAQRPINLGERCTVFMETNVYSHYQKGSSLEDILAGLAYSIVMNYINKVVERKKIGKKIFLQGAVAFNKSVVAAFENYLGREIIVPPDNEVTGAIGTAIVALKNAGNKTKFRGFEKISRVGYTQKSFGCGGCPNICEIKKVSIEGESPLFYGGRCEKYEKKMFGEKETVDLFKERREFLLNSYISNSKKDIGKDKKRIGIPFTMLTYEFYPFWNAFFTELGLEVVLSDKTNKKLIQDGLQSVVAETCFPMKAMLGHIKNLLEKEIHYLFLPAVRDLPCKEDGIKGDRTGSYPCPFVQGMSSVVKAAINIDNVKILDPIINFSFEEYVKEKQLKKLGKIVGKNIFLIKKAIREAYKAQYNFYSSIKKRGKEILDNLKDDEIGIIIAGRPYNSCDEAISMDVPKKLSKIGMHVIPLDYIPLDNIDISEDWPNMYWEFGKRIMSIAEVIKKDKRLYPVCITNFGCGPDSFILQYFEREINKPLLKIEVDEHTGSAGVITRCEAFADSLKNVRAMEGKFKKPASKKTKDTIFRRKEKRTIYIPYMGDGALAIKSSFRAVGIPAEVMHSDDETLECGRKHTRGGECYPFIITTGDMIKILKHNDPKKVAFLMPLTYGPCRFGQYNKLQKIIIRELGYDGIPVISPGAPESLQFYKEYDMEGSKGFKLYLKALKGIFSVDYLDKMLRQTRPYEVVKGKTEKVYKKYLNEICSFLENENNSNILDGLCMILDKARKDFEKIPKTSEKKPLVGIVGEIYVRNHPYSNNEIVRKVESLGAEAVVPPFGEWSYHTTATRKLDIEIKQTELFYRILKYFSPNNKNEFTEEHQSFLELISNFAKGVRFYILNRIFYRMLNHYHHKLEKPLKGFLREEKEADIYEIWNNAEPYIIKWFGEAALSIGKSIDWAKKGVDGVVNVLPFTCMPGTIVTAVSKRLKEDYRIPWLNIAFDGLEQGTTETRIEAFMYQVNQYMQKKIK